MPTSLPSSATMHAGCPGAGLAPVVWIAGQQSIPWSTIRPFENDGRVPRLDVSGGDKIWGAGITLPCPCAPYENLLVAYLDFETYADWPAEKIAAFLLSKISGAENRCFGFGWGFMDGPARAL